MSKPTWKMTEVELAKVWATQFGYSGNHGGWIGYFDDRKTIPWPGGGIRHPWVSVAHGWAAFAKLLTRKGLIREGIGVNWRETHLRLGEKPRLTGRSA